MDDVQIFTKSSNTKYIHILKDEKVLLYLFSRYLTLFVDRRIKKESITHFSNIKTSSKLQFRNIQINH